MRLGPAPTRTAASVWLAGERRRVSVDMTTRTQTAAGTSSAVTVKSYSTAVAPPPSPTPGPPPPPGHHTNVGAVVGGVIGGVAGVAILAALAGLLFAAQRRRRTTRRLDEVYAEAGLGGGGVDRRNRTRPASTDLPPMPPSSPPARGPAPQVLPTMAEHEAAGVASMPTYDSGNVPQTQGPYAPAQPEFVYAPASAGAVPMQQEQPPPDGVHDAAAMYRQPAGAPSDQPQGRATPAQTPPDSPLPAAAPPVAQATVGEGVPVSTSYRSFAYEPEQPTYTGTDPGASPSSADMWLHHKDSRSSAQFWRTSDPTEPPRTPPPATAAPHSRDEDRAEELELSNKLWRTPGTLHVANAQVDEEA